MDKSAISRQRITNAIWKRMETSPAAREPGGVQKVLGIIRQKPYHETVGHEQLPRPGEKTMRETVSESLGLRDPARMTKAQLQRRMASVAVRQTQWAFPKAEKGAAVGPFMNGLIDELKKISVSLPSPATIEEGIPIAKTLSAKILGVLKRRPGLATATAAAAGAGAGVGLAQSQEKKRDEEKRREEIRKLLMSRLQEGGYAQ